MPPRRLLFLYSRLNGFVLSTLRELARSGCCEQIEVVYWATALGNGNQYAPEPVDGVVFHPRDAFKAADLEALIADVRPTTVYLSGWMDPGYLEAVRRRRAGGQAFVTVAGLDDQWRGTWRQRLGVIWFHARYRRLLDVMWTAGPAQYHYARRFGYFHDRIIGSLLSADSERFQPGDSTARRFVFVGRFDPVKGLQALMEAHARLPETLQADWPLVLIGDGPERAALEARMTPYVQIIDYLQPDGVAHELRQGGVGVLGSRWEQWGVSLHEMTMAAMPVIASVQAGAAATFLIDGYNGLLVKGGDVESLARALHAMASSSDDERAAMGRASRILSQRISPEIAAASFLSAEALARM